MYSRKVLIQKNTESKIYNSLRSKIKNIYVVSVIYYKALTAKKCFINVRYIFNTRVNPTELRGRVTKTSWYWGREIPTLHYAGRTTGNTVGTLYIHGCFT